MTPGRSTAELPVLHRLAIIYLMLPVVIWLLGYFHWWFGIPATALLILPVYTYGYFNDLGMRGSLPALLVLCWHCAEVVSNHLGSSAKVSNARQRGYETLLYADARIYALWQGEKCALIRKLPEYEIERVVTGQIHGGRRIWHGAFSLPQPSSSSNDGSSR